LSPADGNGQTPSTKTFHNLRERFGEKKDKNLGEKKPRGGWKKKTGNPQNLAQLPQQRLKKKSHALPLRVGT